MTIFDDDECFVSGSDVQGYVHEIHVMEVKMLGSEESEENVVNAESEESGQQSEGY